MTQLAALIYYNECPPQKLKVIYTMAKLLEDGSLHPVEQDKFKIAIDHMATVHWQPRGYWIHQEPAIAWSPSHDTFAQAWTGPEAVPAPCTFRRTRTPGHRNRPIGDAGFIAPTRSRQEVWRLRQEYPMYIYLGDLLMTPVEVLWRYKESWLRREELANQAAKAYRHDPVLDHVKTGMRIKRNTGRRKWGGR
jgi:hypothetical protein